VAVVVRVAEALLEMVVQAAAVILVILGYQGQLTLAAVAVAPNKMELMVVMAAQA